MSSLHLHASRTRSGRCASTMRSDSVRIVRWYGESESTGGAAAAAAASPFCFCRDDLASAMGGKDTAGGRLTSPASADAVADRLQDQRGAPLVVVRLERADADGHAREVAREG